MNHNTLPSLIDKMEADKFDKPQSDYIKTSCKKCIFRRGNPQTGCGYHGRLAKFIDRTEVYSVQEDDDFYCGINAICTACTQKVPDGENPVEYVDRILEQQIDYIIDSGELKDVVHTYESIVNQEIVPNRIVVLFDSKDYNTHDLYVALSQPELERKNTRFYIVQPTKGTNYNQSMKMCIDKCKAPYFTIFQAGERCPYNIGYTVHQLVNIQLTPFISIDSGGGGTVYLTGLFKKLLKVQRDDDINRPHGVDIYEAGLNMTVPGPKEKKELFLKWNV